MFINPIKFGLTGQNKHKDTKALQQALNLAKQHPGSMIFVPKGEFHVKRALTIYEGTTLFLHEEAVIQRHGNDALLKNGIRNGLYHGYNGNSHITIIGGTFDMNGSRVPDNNTAMCLGHAHSLVLYNIRFKDIVGGHAIDACGVEDTLITRCSFEGFLDIHGDRSFSEAIQLDIQVPGAFPKFGTRDGTITRNTMISECYFGPSETPGFDSWNRAIGSHATRHNQFYHDIFIYRNTFHQTQDFALTPFKADGLYVMDNHFLNCAGGIRFLGTKDDKHTSDIVTGQRMGAQGGRNLNIINNQFEGPMTKDAIHIRGYYNIQHQDVLIVQNHFDTHHSLTLNDIDGLYLDQPELKQSQIKHRNLTHVYQNFADSV